MKNKKTMLFSLPVLAIGLLSGCNGNGTPHEHNFTAASYSWAENGSTCTASRSCTDCDFVEHENGVVTSEVKEESSCTSKGITTYTATFTNDVFETQHKDIADIDELGHDWGDWTHVVGTEKHSRVCKRDAQHVETEDCSLGGYTITTNPSMEAAGVAKQTCSKCNWVKETTIPALSDSQVWSLKSGAPDCETEQTLVYTSSYGDVSITVPAKGHEYDTPTYEWADDGSTCVATAECKNCDHEATETASVTSAEKTPATCEAKGTTTYTATFTNTLFETQTKDLENLSALDHDWGDWTHVENTETHTRVCKRDAQHVENGNCLFGAYQISVNPTLSSAGVAKQTCSVCNYEKQTALPALTDTSVWSVKSGAPDCESDQTVIYTSSYGDVSITVPATQHSYGTPSYEWEESNGSYTCSAKVICNNNEQHIVTEDGSVTSEVTTDPTYVSTGVRTYTATFTNTLFTTQTKEVEIPMKTEVKVTFDYDIEGKEDEVVTGIYGQTIAAKAGGYKDMCEFDGWYNNQEKFDFNTPLSGDITLTAHYKNTFEDFEDGEVGMFAATGSDSKVFEVVDDEQNKVAKLTDTGGITGQINLNNLNQPAIYNGLSKMKYFVFDTKLVSPTSNGTFTVRIKCGDDSFSYQKQFSTSRDAYKNIVRTVAEFDTMTPGGSNVENTLDASKITGIIIAMEYKGAIEIDNVKFLKEYAFEEEACPIPCFGFEAKTVNDAKALFTTNQAQISAVDSETGAITLNSNGTSATDFKKYQSATYTEGTYDLTKYRYIKMNIHSKDGPAKVKLELFNGSTFALGERELVKGDNEILFDISLTSTTKSKFFKNIMLYYAAPQYYKITINSVTCLVG